MVSLPSRSARVYHGSSQGSVLSLSIVRDMTHTTSILSTMTSWIPQRGLPLSQSSRVVLLIGGTMLAAGFGLALKLEPDPRGYGTHRQLGLPECSFQVIFQRPCPACGLTTSVAWFVRGQWQAALRANPGGVLLAVICVGLIPWCWWSAWSGRLWMLDDPWLVVVGLLAGWAAVVLLVGLVRWLN